MHIYSATLQAKPGRGGELGALVPQLRDAVTKTVGSPAYAWAMSAGAPIGCFGISTRVEGNQQLMEFQQKLAASDDYQSVAIQGADLLDGPAQTSLSQIIGSVGEQGDPAPVITITQATVMNGHVADAVGWGMEVLEHVHKVTGQSGLMTNLSAGSFFDIMWIVGAPSAAELDTANDKIQNDAEYIAMLDKAGGFFVPGSATRVTIMRMP